MRALFALGLLLVAAPAGAHAFDPALLELEETAPGAFTVRFTPPRGRDAAEVAPRWPAHCAETAGRLDCGAAGLAGAALLVDGPPGGGDAVVTVRFADGATLSATAAYGEPIALPARPTARATLGRFFGLGVRHILLGADHLLFVLCLLVLLGASWRTVGALTGFTAGHSLSLATASLGLVTLPAAFVEATIALSLLVLARELCRPADAPSLFRRRPLLVALAFGLLHGLGFAGALAELGLPRGQAALALFAFNAGVEAGQLAFVAAALLPLGLLRRRPRLPAYATGLLAACWLFQRVALFGHGAP